jgi:hypothetical protein
MRSRNTEKAKLLRRSSTIALLLVCCLSFVVPASADVRSEAAREIAEQVLKKFGKEAAEESAEKFAIKVETLATRHGDEALDAVKRVGPKAVRVIEEAGANGTQAAKLLARFGDDGAWLARQRGALPLYAKYGDEAAEAMIKHPGIAEPVVAAYGKEGAEALVKLNKENAVWLSRMVNEGDLAKIGRQRELLGVVNKYGDSAMQFIWKHKAPLAVTAGLTAFLANPQPFIDGTQRLATGVLENVAKPIAETPGKVLSNADWTPVLLAIVAVVGVYLFTRNLLPKLLERRTVKQQEKMAGDGDKGIGRR